VEILETLDLGQDRVILRRAEASDVPRIVGLLAADQLGATRDGVGCAESRTCAHRFYERLGFAATHEGMKLVL